MQPLNEGDTSAAMLTDTLFHVTVGAQPVEERLKETEVVVEVAGSGDSPRAFQEANKTHQLR